VSQPSKWWIAFHSFDMTIPEAAGKHSKVCCNFCGTELSAGGKKAVLSSHLSVCNHLAHAIISSIEDCSVPAGGKRIDDEVNVMTLNDIVKPFKEKEDQLIKTSSIKSSKWWYAFHQFDTTKAETPGKEPMVCCNFCGWEVKTGQNFNTKSLHRHLANCNPLAHRIIASIGDGNKAQQIPLAAAPETVPSRGVIDLSTDTDPGTVGKSGQSKLTSQKAQDQSITAVTKCLVANRLPLSLGESKEFQAMLETFSKLGSEGLLSISREATKKRVWMMSVEMKNAMVEEMRGGELITASACWEACGNEKVQFLSASWIHDFALHTAVLDIQPIADTPTSVEASQTLQSTLKEMEISQNVCVPFLISGAAGPSNTIGRTLAEDEHTANILGLDSLLESIVSIVYKQEFFGGDGIVPADVVAKARKLAAMFQTSSKLSQDSVNAQQQMEGKEKTDNPLVPLQDLVKKYWSVYEMISRLMELRAAFCALSENDSIPVDLQLSSAEWDVLVQVQYVLKPFMQAPVLLAGRKYVAASLIPFAVDAIKQALDSILGSGADDLPSEELRPSAVACTKALLASLEETFYDLNNIFDASFEEEPSCVHEAVWIAHALDPRFKKLPTLKGNNKSKRDVVWNGVLKLLVSTVKKQKDLEDRAKEEETSAEEKEAALNADEEESKSAGADLPADIPPQEGTALKGVDTSAGNAVDKFFAALEHTEDENVECLRDGSDESIEQACKNELQAFKFEPQLSFFREVAADSRGGFTKKVENSPLDWWKVNYLKYPFLWKLSKRYLAIPATCAPVRHAFKSDGYSEMLEQLRRASSEGNDQSVFVNENLHWW